MFGKLGDGWTVRENGYTSKVMLEIRASGQKRQGVTLPFKWIEAESASVASLLSWSLVKEYMFFL